MQLDTHKLRVRLSAPAANKRAPGRPEVGQQVRRSWRQHTIGPGDQLRAHGRRLIRAGGRAHLIRAPPGVTRPPMGHLRTGNGRALRLQPDRLAARALIRRASGEWLVERPSLGEPWRALASLAELGRVWPGRACGRPAHLSAGAASGRPSRSAAAKMLRRNFAAVRTGQQQCSDAIQWLQLRDVKQMIEQLDMRALLPI